MTVLTEFCSNKDRQALFNQEVLKVDIGNLLYDCMSNGDVTPKQMAKRLGIKKKRIIRILAGYKNLKLREVADLFTELGLNLSVSVK
jgi:plasmid maintenance system antidote protein VapI